jgi:hypothetical protein
MLLDDITNIVHFMITPTASRQIRSQFAVVALPPLFMMSITPSQHVTYDENVAST